MNSPDPVPTAPTAAGVPAATPIADHMDAHLAHYAGIFAGILVAVTTFAPAVGAAVPPALPYVAAAVAGASALLNVFKVFGVTPVNLIRMLPILFVLAVLTPALHGCKTVPTVQQQELLTVAIDVAVGAAETKGVSAAQINQIAHLALAADNGTAATTAQVVSVVNTQITLLHLPAVDQAAADILVQALTSEVNARISSNPTAANAQATVALVLNDIITVTGG